MRDQVATQFPDAASKFVVLPDPVSEDPFATVDLPEVDQDVFRFITVALFREEKRLDLLLRAFADVYQEYQNTRLMVVGDGPLRHKMRNLTSDLRLAEVVEFTGLLRANEIAVKYQKCQAFVLSSRVETFGIALVEAQFAGLPAVATRCGGPEDIVSAESGILVAANDVGALVDGMRRLYLNYDRYKPGLIREKAVLEFGEEIFFERIRELFSEIQYPYNSGKR